MATRAALKLGNYPTSVSGTVDFVHDEAIDAALVFLVGAGNSNPQDWAGASVGLWDGTNQRAMGITDEHGAGDITAGRRGHNGRIVTVPGTSGSAFADGTASAQTTTVTDDTLRVTADSTYGVTPCRMSALLLSGIADARCGHVAVDSNATAVSLPFEPDVVFLIGQADTASLPYGAGFNRMIIGIAHRDASDVYSHHCLEMTTVAGSDPTEVHCQISNTDSHRSYWGGAVQWNGQARDFSPSGFNIDVTSGSNSSRQVMYLALRLDSADDFAIDLIDTQTSTGAAAHTGWPFEPDVVGLLANGCAAADTVYTSGVGTMHWGFGDGTSARSLSYSVEDDVATTNCQSLYDDSHALYLVHDDGALDCAAALTPTSDGFSLNYSDAAASVTKVIAFGFGDSETTPPPGTVTLSNDFACGNANSGSLTQDWTNPTEPVLSWFSYPTDDSSFGFHLWAFAAKFDGVNGTRPLFRHDDQTFVNQTSPTTVYYSYDVDGPYLVLGTKTNNGTWDEYQGASAFTQDTVYLWSHIPSTPGFMASWVADLFTNYPTLIHRCAADLAYTTDPTTGVIGTIVSGFDTYWGKVIPDLPQYAFRLSDDTYSPPGGKRRMILSGGMHAGEWEGMVFVRKAVEFILAGADGGSADEQAGYDIRRNFEILVIPQSNPNGHYGGHHRCTFEDGDGDNGANNLDTNRDWDVATSALDTIANVKAAIAAEFPNGKVNIFWDQHSSSYDYYPYIWAINASTNNPDVVSLLSAMTTYFPDWNATIEETSSTLAADAWASPADSDYGFFTVCDVPALGEIPTPGNYSETGLANVARSFVRGVDDRYVAGDYGAAAPGVTISDLQAVNVTATTVTPQVDVTVN